MKRNISCRLPRLVASLLVPSAMLLAVSSAQGALLGITPSYPDITTSGTDITYAFVAGTGGTLTINGGAASNLAQQTIKFFNGDSAHFICQGTTSCNPNTTYSLEALFNASGVFTGGSLNILGYVDGSTASGYQAYAGLANTGTLYTASLTGFGFNGSHTTGATFDNLVLDFSILGNGGDLFTAFGTGNGLIWNGRVNTDGSATYGGNWDDQIAPMTKSFGCTVDDTVTANKCTATLNTFVPVPAAVWLLGSGLVGLMGVANRNRKARVAR